MLEASSSFRSTGPAFSPFPELPVLGALWGGLAVESDPEPFWKLGLLLRARFSPTWREMGI